MDTDLPSAVLTVAIAGIILFIGVFAVSAVIDVGSTNSGDGTTTQTAALLDGTNWVQIDNTRGIEETVYDSRGYAIELTGANDSYIQSTSNLSLNQYSTWTVSVWASRDTATSESMVALDIEGQVLLAYNGSTSTWTGWWYDVGSSASYRVNVSTTANPGQLENIVLDRSASSLQIYANNTAGESVTVDGNNTEAIPTGGHWDGRLEELRVADDSWTSANISHHYSNPIDPITTGQNARVMFDEPYRQKQRLFWHAGDINHYNSSFADGIDGSEMVAGSVLLQQSDYEWSPSGPQIRAIAGGELENAPVAYVDYNSRIRVTNLADQYGNAIALAGVLLILVPVVLILGYLFAVRGGR